MSDTTPVSQKTLTKLYIGIPAAIVAVTLLFIIFGGGKPPQMPMRAQPVILDAVKTLEISEATEYVAAMEADSRVELRARVSGLLLAKNFEDGDLVKKGQVLFLIEPDQYQAQMETAQADFQSAKAQLDLATQDFKRIGDLYQKNTSPKSDYDSSKSAFEVAQAAVLRAQGSLTLAQLNLDYASIKAPFDGWVSDSPYSVGSLLGPESGVLATVVSVDPILATFGVSDKIISSAVGLNPAQPGAAKEWQVRLRLGPDRYYDQAGPLSYVAPTVDPQTDTIKFKAKFTNPKRVLRPGQIVTAVVERVTPLRKLVVPKEAVLTDTQGRFVYIPKEVPADPNVPDSQPGMVAEMRRVVVGGGELEQEYIIESGLTEGEQFIRKGLMSGGATLRPGAPIMPAPQEGAAPAEGQPADAETTGGAE
ncbi:MAG: efflux RND transporter periplasmic adaptor subunit [Candidatus Adiutrix sp.]|jgi:membrane fusion protein (multidrug efflux system)|nr:efflux RND transporter periplasmic adaptor subunit [Candidatus Adiutrix sp.]